MESIFPTSCSPLGRSDVLKKYQRRRANCPPCCGDRPLLENSAAAAAKKSSAVCAFVARCGPSFLARGKPLFCRANGPAARRQKLPKNPRGEHLDPFQGLRLTAVSCQPPSAPHASPRRGDNRHRTQSSGPPPLYISFEIKSWGRLGGRASPRRVVIDSSRRSRRQRDVHDVLEAIDASRSRCRASDLPVVAHPGRPLGHTTRPLTPIFPRRRSAQESSMAAVSARSLSLRASNPSMGAARASVRARRAVTTR